MGPSAATTDFMVIFMDPQGIARAWGIAGDYQKARREARRQLDIYLDGRRRLGDSLTSESYEEEVHHVPKERTGA